MRRLVFLLAVAACGGAKGGPVPTHASSAPSPSPSPGNDVARAPTESANAPAKPCARPAPVIARAGESVSRPKGSALRFQLVYQGTHLAVRELRGVDQIIGGSDGPFAAGKNSGWWAELRSAAGATIFTRLFRDPTVIEGPGAHGGFVNVTVDACKPKIILVDVPNDPAGSELVVFGNDNGPARELARFTLK